MTIKQLCAELEVEIQNTYTKGVSLDEAEKLAARFLHAQIVLSDELKTADLDSRMQKSGVKAIRAAVYLAEVQKNDKKPSDILLTAIVDSTDEVLSAQNNLDTSEVTRVALERYYDIFSNAHIYYRNLSKGNYGS